MLIVTFSFIFVDYSFVLEVENACG